MPTTNSGADSRLIESLGEVCQETNDISKACWIFPDGTFREQAKGVDMHLASILIALERMGREDYTHPQEVFDSEISASGVIRLYSQKADYFPDGRGEAGAQTGIKEPTPEQYASLLRFYEWYQAEGMGLAANIHNFYLIFAFPPREPRPEEIGTGIGEVVNATPEGLLRMIKDYYF
jgi:hypothetical protein